MKAKTSTSSSSTTSSLIKVENLTVCYGHTRAISNINLEINKGDYLGIIGPNGGGKTTFLKTLLGLIGPTEGNVLYFNKTSREKKKSFIGYVPQVATLDRSFPANVEDVVLTGKLNKKIIPFFRYNLDDRKDVRNILEKMEIFHLKDRQLSSLSGGEFQKMLIARAMATDPEILILDEPTASIDAHSKTQIYDLLKKLNREKTILLVTHDLSIVSSHVTSLAYINETLAYHGKPQLNERILREMYGYPLELDLFNKMEHETNLQLKNPITNGGGKL